MKITLESTSQIVRLDGIECRVWEGTTASGIAVTAFIPRIAVLRDADASEFERELVEQRQPSPGDEWPLRMVL